MKCAITLMVIFILAPTPHQGQIRAQEPKSTTKPATAWSKGAGKDLAYPVADDPHKLIPVLKRELSGCFQFFWNEAVMDRSLPTYGMVNGNGVGTKTRHPLCIEGQGFYFATIVIGVERGWITFDQGYKRIVNALRSIKRLKHFHGYYYHFIDRKTGLRGWNDAKNVEVTNAGTATMIAGALVAGEYFGGEVKKLANELYRRVDWKWFSDPKKKHFYLACYPEDVPKGTKVLNDKGFIGHWATYSEHMIMYVLGAGAPKPDFAVTAEPYYKMITYKGSYKGKKFIYCTTGAAFTYQWTHCFVDYRNRVDRKGRNWFDNSRHAAIAARQFAIDMSGKVKGLGPNSWGMSACISPTTFYSGRYGSLPAGTGSDVSVLLMDGTVAPYGSSGFIVFTPTESIAALKYMYAIPGLVGKYGLYDAYSFHTKAKGDVPWVSPTYLDIDKGIVALMIENYSTQLIWKLFHQNKCVQSGLAAMGFTNVK
ncbi:MAG: glucoamylase family protein [Phycisphaerae bacterium]|jgi:hypothetical protein|nr:glucoamylase family protein [Phycisphaerae bacterium]